MVFHVRRTLEVLVLVLGIGAAIFLLDAKAPVWLRVLPWLFVFGYPFWSARRKRSP
jgi:hypothetical protein